MKIYEINKKLIGSILPYGDSNIDEERTNNLEIHNLLTYELIKDLIEVAGYRYRKEFSIHKMGISAYSTLLELKEMIDSEIEG